MRESTRQWTVGRPASMTATPPHGSPLRLPETLKAEIDAAASTAAISVNTWLVRAARGALARGPGPRNRSAQHIRGWVTG